jgi:hypothetical protein
LSVEFIFSIIAKNRFALSILSLSFSDTPISTCSRTNIREATRGALVENRSIYACDFSIVVLVQPLWFEEVNKYDDLPFEASSLYMQRLIVRWHCTSGTTAGTCRYIFVVELFYGFQGLSLSIIFIIFKLYF